MDVSVTSPDGTTIGAHDTGSGRPVVLVHGGVGDASAWDGVRRALSAELRTVAMDRRGRGRSGRAEDVEHSLAIEADDVVAVAEHVGGRVGGRPLLAAHSIGATIGLEALRRRPDPFAAAVLYEPPLPGMPSGLGTSDAMLAALDEGRHDDALVAFLRDMMQLPDEDITAYRDSPLWATRVGLIWTMRREAAALRALPTDLDRYRAIDLPVTLLVGDRTAPHQREAVDALADTLPHATVRTLAGHGHGALVTAPHLVARAIEDRDDELG